MFKSLRSSSLFIIAAILTASMFSSTLLAENPNNIGFDLAEYQARQYCTSPNISPGSTQAITVNVTAPAVFKLVGSSFSVPVTVSDTTGAGIISWQFDLLYDPAIITPQVSPVDTAGTLGSGLLVTVNGTTPGLLKVVLFGSTPISGPGTLFNFKFTAIGTAGQSSPLTWQNFMFNEGDPANTAANGSVTLVSPTAAGASVSGRVVSSFGRAIPNAQVVMTNDVGLSRRAISNPFGFYRFENVPAGSTYVLTASSKRFTFQPRVVSFVDDLSGFDLTAEP